MRREFIEGSEIICQAALYARCNFFAGYPITPATPILLNMMRSMPEVGGTAIQGEDEIASIAMCIGASMAGAKAMTATSGPGISLYSENIGLAIMGEVPLVIVDVQRLGPATGGATTGAQGDVQFVRWVTSGGLPMVVLVPSDIQSIFSMTVHAFNLAEQLRTPVFVLTSKDMVLARHTWTADAMEPMPVVDRILDTSEGPFIPYQVETPADIPSFLPIGSDRPVRFTTSMHDECGYLTRTPYKVDRLIHHLEAKILSHIDRITSVHHDPCDGAETLLIAYGINAPTCRQVIRTARNRGRACSLLVIESLFPIPENAIRSALAGIRTVILPELNTGLYAEAIRHCIPPSVELVPLRKINGEMFAPDEILKHVET